MTDAPGIAAEKYIRLTTYTKDGRAKHVPVWVAPLADGKLGVATVGTTWKVRRIRNDPRVALQPSSSRGAVVEGSEELTGTAEILSGPDREPVVASLADKYGWQWSTARAFYWFRNVFKRGDPDEEVGIVITLTGHSGHPGPDIVDEVPNASRSDDDAAAPGGGGNEPESGDGPDR